MTGEILSSDGPFFFLQNSLFDLITRCSRFYHKLPCFFYYSEIHFLIQKIHLEKSHFFWSFPRPFLADPHRDLSYVCGGFNKKIASKFTCIYQPRHARRLVWRLFFLLLKKNACSPRAVNDFNKTYRTSAVPLLVRNVSYVCGAVARNSWNRFKIKLKNIEFLRWILEKCF